MKKYILMILVLCSMLFAGNLFKSDDGGIQILKVDFYTASRKSTTEFVDFNYVVKVKAKRNYTMLLEAQLYDNNRQIIHTFKQIVTIKATKQGQVITNSSILPSTVAYAVTNMGVELKQLKGKY